MIESDPIKESGMWYFAWILGIGVALGFGIINVMWLDANDTFLPDSAEGSDVPASASEDKHS